jgi:ABC-type sugar transport system ATPase subunit
VFVTHDQNEASGIAHRIAFVLNGRIEQHGPPREFFTAPATLATARFFGWQVLETTDRTTTVFRPESVDVRHGGIHRVESSTDLGLRVQTTVRLANGRSVDVQHPPPVFQEGDCVTVEIQPSAMRVIKECVWNPSTSS